MSDLGDVFGRERTFRVTDFLTKSGLVALSVLTGREIVDDALTVSFGEFLNALYMAAWSDSNAVASMLNKFTNSNQYTYFCNDSIVTNKILKRVGDKLTVRSIIDAVADESPYLNGELVGAVIDFLVGKGVPVDEKIEPGHARRVIRTLSREPRKSNELKSIVKLVARFANVAGMFFDESTKISASATSYITGVKGSYYPLGYAPPKIGTNELILQVFAPLLSYVDKKRKKGGKKSDGKTLIGGMIAFVDSDTMTLREFAKRVWRAWRIEDGVITGTMEPEVFFTSLMHTVVGLRDSHTYVSIYLINNSNNNASVRIVHVTPDFEKIIRCAEKLGYSRSKLEKIAVEVFTGILNRRNVNSIILNMLNDAIERAASRADFNEVARIYIDSRISSIDSDEEPARAEDAFEFVAELVNNYYHHIDTSNNFTIMRSILARASFDEVKRLLEYLDDGVILVSDVITLVVIRDAIERTLTSGKQRKVKYIPSEKTMSYIRPGDVLETFEIIVNGDFVKKPRSVGDILAHPDKYEELYNRVKNFSVIDRVALNSLLRGYYNSE